MKRFKTFGYALSILAMVTALFFSAGTIALAATTVPDSSTGAYVQQAENEENITLTSQYPALQGSAGQTFTYEIALNYSGSTETKFFEFNVTVPEGFYYRVQKTTGTEEIPGISIDPTETYPEPKMKVVVGSYPWMPPEPGEYSIVVEAVSGNVRGSIELTAIITEQYEISLSTPSGRMNTEAQVGKENTFIMEVANTGSTTLEGIEFESSIRGNPTGWEIDYQPETIDTLVADDSREITVTIVPPDKTIAGDYEITFTAQPDSGDASDSMEIRTTVLTPTIWGWVGVIIVILVVAGLIFMFWRLGRR